MPVVYWSASQPKEGIIAKGFQRAFRNAAPQQRPNISKAADTWWKGVGIAGFDHPAQVAALAQHCARHHGVGGPVLAGLASVGVGAATDSLPVRAAQRLISDAEAMGRGVRDVLTTPSKELGKTVRQGIESGHDTLQTVAQQGGKTSRSWMRDITMGQVLLGVGALGGVIWMFKRK